ncbi:ATP-binding protein, partial [Kibdelosporangium lantanae]
MDPITLAAVFWPLLAVALVLSLLLVRQLVVSRNLRRWSDQAQEELRARTREEEHLVSVRLPALVEALGHRPVEV